MKMVLRNWPLMIPWRVRSTLSQLLLVASIWGVFRDCLSARPSNRRKVVLLVLDGFANYYLDKNNRDTDLSGFRRLFQQGARAEYLLPVFPTLSLPNLYSLATGLYTEKHRISSDVFWDRGRNRYFNGTHQPSDFESHWWNATKPVWVEAQAQGVNTALFWWPGCQVKFSRSDSKHSHSSAQSSRSRPYCLPYQDVQSTLLLGDRFDDLILPKLKNDEWQFVLLFHKYVDEAGHHKGPYSGELKDAVERTDSLVSLIQEGLAQNGLEASMDFIVVSTHGMAKTQFLHSSFFIDDFLPDIEWIQTTISASGALLLLYPVKSKEYQVYQSLTKDTPIPHMNVYWREELPLRWHWKEAPFLSPIVILADTGYGIFCRTKKKIYPPIKDEMTADMFPKGAHGYDNSRVEMRGLFAARGPDFRRNVQSGYVSTVDVYQILCRILDLQQCHEHDGSWSRIAPLVNMSINEAVRTTSACNQCRFFILWLFVLLLHFT